MQHAEADAPATGSHGPLYVGIGVGSLVLTAIAFYVVGSTTGLRPYEVPIIVVLAVGQLVLQVMLFMHLREGRQVYSMFFGYGAFLALVVAWSIGYVLTAYVPPTAKVAHLSHTQLIALGGTIVTQQCESCHTVNGHGGTFGPNMNQVLAGTVNLVPGGKPTSTTWLTSWISDPQSIWPQAKMPDLGLTPQQVQGVVDYLEANVK